MSPAPDYDRRALADALRAAWVRPGDVVFAHSNVGCFGMPAAGPSAEGIFETVHGAFLDVLGPDGTLVVPTFTYSFCKGEPFDPAETPSTCGLFTEMLRRLPEAFRSWDPIFSVAATGGRARAMTEDVPQACFGEGSFWHRFLEADGLVCNLNLDSASTFVHFVERRIGVPYRYDKLFPGWFRIDGTLRKGAAIHFCHDLSNPATHPRFEPFDRLARARGLARSVPVGRGAVVAIRAADTVRVIEEGLRDDPWMLTASAGADSPPPLVAAPDGRRPAPRLPADDGVRGTVEALWDLPRHLVSDGYDASLEALAGRIPMTVHAFRTGTHCWTWIVPEKWTCEEARLETTDGRTLFSTDDHPLHAVSYSLPFEGEVTREELLGRLHVHDPIPDAIPFVFRYYERDWGLACTRRQRDALDADRYRVVVRARFARGELKVGEVVVPGEREESFVLVAHLCHPHQANDDLTGVAVGVDLLHRLLDGPRPKWTWRLLLLPETIGSIAWLSRHEKLIPTLRGGLFLEMLGREVPHALQHSFAGDTPLDRLLGRVLAERDPGGWTGPFRSIICNDERQFNAPGVRVPMLSLSRCLPRSDPDWPFREYHTHLDTPDRIPVGTLEASRDLAWSMLRAIEEAPANAFPPPAPTATVARDGCPSNRFKGEIFLSRYGLEGERDGIPISRGDLFHVIERIDGTRPVARIAEECGVSPEAVERVVERLARAGLVTPARSANG